MGAGRGEAGEGVGRNEGVIGGRREGVGGSGRGGD